MLLTVLGLFLGLLGLYFGGEWLVKGASRLARSLGISALIVGLTVVSIGTSMPELLVSVGAALRGSADIAIGNVVGSNIANIGLILGISGLIYPIGVHVTLLRREIPLMLAVIVIAYLMLLNGDVSRVDGVLLVAGMFGFIAFMIISARKEQQTEHDIPEETTALEEVTGKRLYEVLRLFVGIAVLMVGAQLTVENAISIARTIGISELMIGVTLVAVGTSLPELVTSTMAAFRQESDIAIGNVIGSNIFNVLGILGTTAIIQPIQVSSQIRQFDGLVMIGFALLVIPFAANRRLGRREALLFLTAYVGYIAYSVINSL
ncbi:MAG: calcium/sodium antiporter [Chloroflexota bacterium]